MKKSQKENKGKNNTPTRSYVAARAFFDQKLDLTPQ